MAKQGRAGPALATAALGSFFAGTVATVLVALFAPPLSSAALKFGPAEYFSLVVLGLIASIVLASGSLLKALAMIVLGLLLGMVGQDIYTGTPRFTLGARELYDGIDFVALAVGLFGIAEILRTIAGGATRAVKVEKASRVWLSRRGVRADHQAGVPGYRDGLGARRPARRRARAGLVHVVLPGEAVVEASRAFRQGRHRGRGRTGVGQQRSGTDVVHPAAHSRACPRIR